MKAERWKPIPSTGGIYEASTHGRIRSVTRVVATKNRWGDCNKISYGRTLQQTINKSTGYPSVSLSIDRKRFYPNVHRLIAEAFLGACPHGKEVNHIDGNKTNNSIENLEYITRSENLGHAYRLGLASPPRGEKCGTSKLNEMQVRIIRRCYALSISQGSLSRLFNISRRQIRKILSRESWGHVA